MTYPGKLTAFELSMLLEDAGNSMTSMLILQARGSLDTDDFTKAVVAALGNHPLLSATVRRDRVPLNSEWVPRPVSADCVRVIPLEADYRSPWEKPVNLEVESGTRILVRHSADRSEIRFCIHHSCCDGLGGLRFVEDVLIRYDGLRGGDSAPVEFDRLALKERDVYPAEKLPLLKRIQKSLIVRPRRIRQLLFSAPAEIARGRRNSEVHLPDAADEKHFVETMESIPCRTFSVLESNAIKRYARDRKLSLNNYMISELIAGLQQYNQDSGSKADGPVRILVPFSLRDRRHRKMSAANCVSMAFIEADRKAQQDGLAEEIESQFQHICKWQLQYAWLQSTRTILASPFLTRFLMQREHRRIATTVFSNLGRMFKRLPRNEEGNLVIGDLEIESVRPAVPVHGNVAVTFASFFYANRLGIAMNYDRRKLKHEQALELLDFYFERLSRMAHST
ncbi:MAG: hypothetical protein AAF456_08110 [Planctomycetota bacterium]